MKNVIIILSAVLMLAAGCDRFTDIEPKGVNLLRTVDDLETLLNYQASGEGYGSPQAMMLVNDFFGTFNVYKTINEPGNSLITTALFTWDPAIDRALHTTSSAWYDNFYSTIGTVCNPVILLADRVEGDRLKADRLKAEAYILRAWHHYLLVNIYAKAYDPATAAEDGGIPYSRENDLYSKPNPKYSVQEVYDFILEDIESALSLNSLASPSGNRMRVNSAFGYAVKAKVLMSLRDYEGAYKAASDALAIENTVDDYNTMLLYTDEKFNFRTGDDGPGYSLSRPEMSSREDLFYAKYVYLFQFAIPPEFGASFEPGNILNIHADKEDYSDVTSTVQTFGFYDNNVYLNPGGLSTVDMYLTQAECLIRKGDRANIDAAMDIINMIRRHRVATEEVYTLTTQMFDTDDKIDPADFYAPYTASDMAAAIGYLKQMVRAECWFGPRRFICLKRWNTETQWRETITKHVECVSDGKTVSYDYTLPYDSPLWIFAFPARSVSLNPNLTQNYK